MFGARLMFEPERKWEAGTTGERPPSSARFSHRDGFVLAPESTRCTGRMLLGDGCVASG